MKYLQCSYTTQFQSSESMKQFMGEISLVWMPDSKKIAKIDWKTSVLYQELQNLKKIEERCAESWNMIK